MSKTRGFYTPKPYIFIDIGPCGPNGEYCWSEFANNKSTPIEHSNFSGEVAEFKRLDDASTGSERWALILRHSEKLYSFSYVLCPGIPRQRLAKWHNQLSELAVGDVIDIWVAKGEKSVRMGLSKNGKPMSWDSTEKA